MIDWVAFLLVFVWAMLGASIVVSSYAFGIRLLTLAGRTPVVSPAEFTDAITVMTPAEVKTAEKKARKAAKKSPLSEAQKRIAHIGAWVCFIVSAIAVVVGIYLIVGDHLFEIFSR